MSLAAYLAKNYLTADPPDRPKKKRKKTKHSDPAEGGGGLIIADDDPPDLRTASETSKFRKSGLRGGDNDEDDGGPTIANIRQGRPGEFRKSKSTWKTVEGPSAPSNAEQMEADAILASAAAEREAQVAASNEGPTIEGEEDDGAGPRMESGARAGLQTAAQTAAMVAAQEKRREADARSSRGAVKGLEGETIYRDASGRIINVAMKRAEARKIAEEAKAAEAAEKEARTGDVQRREKAARKEALEDAKYMPVARGVDDEEMNRELKARQRWNDPAAEFLSSNNTTTAAEAGPVAAGGSKARKKVYTGPAAPNRYGIRPGHRWDGVDRGNGFESQWFAARNKKGMREELEYAWAMDE